MFRKEVEKERRTCRKSRREMKSAKKQSETKRHDILHAMKKLSLTSRALVFNRIQECITALGGEGVLILETV